MEGNADDVLHALIKLKTKIKFLIYLEKVLQEQKKLPMLLETKQVQIHLCVLSSNCISIDEHTKLLDDINAKVDKTNAKVRNTTRRVERVEKKSSTKVMWLIICILLLGLIAVVFLSIYT